MQITLPTTRVDPFKQRQAQSKDPVRVLVTPQYRTSHIAPNGAITEKTHSTVPTATGAAEMTIEPEKPHRFRPSQVGFDDGLNFFNARFDAMASEMNDRERSALALALLAETDPPEDMEAFNKQLAELGSGIRLATVD
ncbi:MAG: hypothetical protein RIB45_10955 [Marivibrio sp.]|uniref:hypothetical protein n=1 Tax=Marivibrio sp. TaxID=2039719 RepID=UPI0032EF59FC